MAAEEFYPHPKIQRPPVHIVYQRVELSMDHQNHPRKNPKKSVSLILYEIYN